MDVVLDHAVGYEVMSEVEEIAVKNAKESGGSFTKTNSMAEAFKIESIEERVILVNQILLKDDLLNNLSRRMADAVNST